MLNAVRQRTENTCQAYPYTDGSDRARLQTTPDCSRQFTWRGVDPQPESAGLS